MSCIQQMDELVKEYLLFRGFSGTLKALDTDLKSDKDKAFRPDKIVDQFINYITIYDLNGLKDYWNHFDQLVFERLDQHFMPAIKKMESSLLRMYLVNASVNSKPEKIIEFFEKLGSELQNQPEWKDWFALPFIKNPEENPNFMVYFTRQWQDTMLISLHNLLAVTFQCLPQPKLTAYNEEANRSTRLQTENEYLKSKITKSSLSESQDVSTTVLTADNLPAGLDLVDDFYLIPAETSPADNHSRSFRNFIRGFSNNGFSNSTTNSTSPVSHRRVSPSPVNRF